MSDRTAGGKRKQYKANKHSPTDVIVYLPNVYEKHYVLSCTLLCYQFSLKQHVVSVDPKGISLTYFCKSILSYNESNLV